MAANVVSREFKCAKCPTPSAKNAQPTQLCSSSGLNIKWYTTNCRRPSNKSSSLSLPPVGDSNSYSLSTLTTGKVRRSLANASLARVAAFSLTSNARRASSHSSRDTTCGKDQISPSHAAWRIYPCTYLGQFSSGHVCLILYGLINVGFVVGLGVQDAESQGTNPYIYIHLSMISPSPYGRRDPSDRLDLSHLNWRAVRVAPITMLPAFCLHFRGRYPAVLPNNGRFWPVISSSTPHLPLPAPEVKSRKCLVPCHIARLQANF